MANEGVIHAGRHEAYYRSKEDQTITLDREGVQAPKVQIAEGELLNIEWSYKASLDYKQFPRHSC